MFVNRGLKKLNEGSLTCSGAGIYMLRGTKERVLHFQFLEEPF
jgi:hypothetical protein